MISPCADRTEGRPDAVPAAAESTPRLCPHLAPALGELLRQGANIVAALPLAWSRVDLEATLDSGPPLAQGSVCLSCRHGLGWPLQAGGTRPS